MTDIKRFNEAMAALSAVRETSGVNLKGKIYAPVKDRIEIFRRNFGDDFRIDTDVHYPNGFDRGASIVAIAKVMDVNGMVVASGHAMERVGASNINTTNPVEMAETSAIGRALACFGLGGGEYASGDEMVNFFIKQQTIEPGHGNQSQKVEEKKEEAPKPAPTSGLYLPSDEMNAVWFDPKKELDRVIAALDSVKNVTELGKYWSELSVFRNGLTEKMLIAELKAAFAQRNNQLAG